MLKVLFFLISFFAIVDAGAQMLPGSDVSKQSVVKDVKTWDIKTKNKTEQLKSEKKLQKDEGVTLEELTRQNASSDNKDVVQTLSDSIVSDGSFKQQKDEEKKDGEEDVFIPEGELSKLNKEPTIDGSKRGGRAFVQMDEKGRMKKVEKIFLFYDNFKITNYISNVGTCDVRFNILSNLDRKISQLDVKLVWPGLTTTLSFSNINPNTQTYYNYALIGNGCYNMDKAPNIIVNRCRVKGMTASECADKLLWLSK